MEFLIGCRNIEEDATEPTIVEEEYQNQFEFSDIVTKVSRKGLKLSPQYNIVTNQDIIFHVKVEMARCCSYLSKVLNNRLAFLKMNPVVPKLK